MEKKVTGRVKVDESLWLRIKSYSVLKKRALPEIVEEALKEYMERKEGH